VADLELIVPEWLRQRAQSRRRLALLADGVQWSFPRNGHPYADSAVAALHKRGGPSQGQRVILERMAALRLGAATRSCPHGAARC